MSTYCGRFAPTPSGELHFGSLIAAVGSFLRARSQKGFWHLRIEDIDIQRCKDSYTSSILKCLDSFGLYYDGEIYYQSKRLDIYAEILNSLTNKHLTYGCDCPRSLIKANGGFYPNTCRAKKIPPVFPHAVRFINNEGISEFNDLIYGRISAVQNNQVLNEDFILKRHDNLFAYNLVSIVDDHLTGVSEIVRGNDLLLGTFRQIALMQALDYKIPNYMHLPLALEHNGLKFSKQNHAQPLDTDKAPELLKKALAFLGQPIPLGDNCHTILSQAITNFDYHSIPHNDRKITY